MALCVVDGFAYCWFGCEPFAVSRALGLEGFFTARDGTSPVAGIIAQHRRSMVIQQEQQQQQQQVMVAPAAAVVAASSAPKPEAQVQAQLPSPVAKKTDDSVVILAPSSGGGSGGGGWAIPSVRETELAMVQRSDPQLMKMRHQRFGVIKGRQERMRAAFDGQKARNVEEFDAACAQLRAAQAAVAGPAVAVAGDEVEGWKAAAAARHADEAVAREARLKAADTDAAARFAAFQRMLAGGEESASDSAAMSDTNNNGSSSSSSSSSGDSSSLEGALEGEMMASDEEDGCLQFSAVEEAVWAAEARAEIEADEAGTAIEWA